MFIFDLYNHLSNVRISVQICKRPSSREEGSVATETTAAPLGETMDIMTALQLVLRKSLAHSGLARGLHEGAKLCKIDSEGKARKVVGCSCVVVKDFGEQTEGYNVIQEYVKSH
ncbi:40S ribosomal protein S12-like isoform X3 [Carya illinoinensis]|uniref:40S ribosomal protein S12-like isoform X3 n=1 Tax=Carya illinoinensis TaxID=32201 RepID=UPI001C71832D|nr:40S ribosomal protein S12-like isoform X3 [Carya illinoinensis]